MRRQATVKEIRAYWGHGEGNRKVAVNKYSGRVRWWGGRLTIPVDEDDHTWWHDAGFREDYRIDTEGHLYVI